MIWAHPARAFPFMTRQLWLSVVAVPRPENRSIVMRQVYPPLDGEIAIDWRMRFPLRLVHSRAIPSPVQR
jgi:hypothetical protein